MKTQFSTNYRAVPIETKPEKEGFYWMCKPDTDSISDFRDYYNGDKWSHDPYSYTHYLLPIENSFVVDIELLRKVFTAGMDKGYNFDKSDFETSIDNILKPL